MTNQDTFHDFRTSSDARLRRTSRWLSLVSIPALALLPVACNGSKSADLTPGGDPGETEDGGLFISDDHFGGNSTSLRIADMYWGRLVDVFGLDSGGGRVLMNEDFVIAAGLVSDPFDYDLQVNPVTGSETLLIRRDVTTEVGMQQYVSLLRQSEANRTPIFDNGPGGSGLFTMVPRNAAMIVRFNDLLDPASVTNRTVRVLTGSPSVEPFEARVFADRNHGGNVPTSGGDRFYPTRVIIDPAVSEADAFAADPPLPVNGLGLPASIRVDLSNVEVRIPTEIAPSFGQDAVLTNLSGHGLLVADNGTADLSSPTDDVVRAVRAGGSSGSTADPHNGFLRDDIPPQLIGVQSGFIQTPPIQDPADPNEFRIEELQFSSTACARRPRIGDVIEQPGIFAEVTALGTPPINGLVRNVRVRLVLFPPEFSGPGDWVGSALGPVDYLTVFEQVADAGVAECFAQFAPGAPNLAFPTEDLSVATTVGLRFSEPMDPLTLTAFDSMTLTRVENAISSDEYVIGEVARSPDLRNFSFVPRMNLAHRQGDSEEYFFNLLPGSRGARDLAGNVLPIEFPQVRFDLSSSQATVRNGGRVTRFSDPDEDEPIGQMQPLPEWNGQHFYDLQGQFIRPRPVSRFQAIADRSSAVIGLMNAFPQGVQTPLSPFGCRLMHIYRYVDVGFSITDTTNYNIDVEGLNWAPANGQVTADFFPQYEMRLTHSKHAPDENIELPSLFPEFPNSGLKPNYAFQALSPDLSPDVVVHPRDRGYTIDPGAAFTTPTGTLMMPWPMNTDASFEPRRYTWRDTAILGRGGDNNEGVDPKILEALGLTRQVLYSTGDIQTIGLPLLIEHRCYPAASDALGNNSLEIAFAVNSSRRPFFRAFSVGGFAAGGTIVEVDPDLETRANGGFNPANAGAPTPGQDPNVYYGAMDFVVRVSRSVSVWFQVSDPAGDPFETPRFDQPIVEPRPQDQPSGTSVDLAFRGAVSITDSGLPESNDPRYSATSLDSYGNHYEDLTMPRDEGDANETITFLTGDEEWLPLDPDAASNPMGIDGSQYYQIRASFSANPTTSLVPTLSAIALSWE